ncbi:MAG TPA: MFS transporter [Roseiflexaceae bacterium]|nr:MFS transporter [Roseiflexaceae bacterium]
MATSATTLWRHADFLRLWAGQTISRFGSQIGAGALGLTAILVLSATPAQMGLLAAAATLPTLLIGLPAGVWADRLRRRPMLIGADLGRALLLLSVPLAALGGLLTMLHLYVITALVGMLTILFDVAYQAYVPTLLAREQIVEGNSKLGVSDSVAEIAGPPLGGALVQLISAPWTVAWDAVSFLVSAFALWRIRTSEHAPAQPESQQRFIASVGDGLRTTTRQPVLRTLLVSTAGLSLAGGIIGSLHSLYAIRELGLSPVLLGTIVGIGGCGALVGALLAGRITQRFGVGPAIVVALGSVSVTALLIPFAAGQWAVPLLLLSQIGDVAWPIFFINELSLRQAVTPARVMGRVNASMQFAAAAAALVGALAGGFLGETIGLRAAMAVGVGMLICTSMWVAASPIRALRALPEPDGINNSPTPAAASA